MDALQLDAPNVTIPQSAHTAPVLRANVLRVAAAGVVGLTAWSGSLPAIALAAVLPVLCFSQPNRLWAGFAAFAYYLAALWPVALASVLFFEFESPVLGVGLVLLCSVLLAGPWYACWAPAGSKLRPLMLVAACALTVVPPLGICGVAHPLTSVGVLFPGTGLYGLVLAAGLYAFWSINPRQAFVIAVLAAIGAHGVHRVPEPPEGWSTINTRFGPQIDPMNPLREFQTAEFMQRVARESSARVIVFPEGMVQRWNESTDAFWEPTLRELRDQGRVLLVGAAATLPSQSSERGFRNLVIIRGALNREVDQHIPVPLAMWNPTGVPLNLAGPATVGIAGKRAALLICYEQFLPWLYIMAAAHDADVLVGSANVYWVKGTPVADVQRSTLRAWSRLFGIPFVAAVNE